MNYGLHELWMSTVALLALPTFFLAPGYVAASVLNPFRFRTRRAAERMLWATALSQPLCLILAVHPGVPTSPLFTDSCFLILGVGAVALALRDRRADRLLGGPILDRNSVFVLWAAAALVVYCLLAAAPLQIGDRLYESSLWQDWSVRLALVNAAIRGGNHPGNPMFAPGGQAAPLHYYYFWYTLCARMHDLVPVSARATLVASCAGSSLALMAFLLLSIKYLGPRRRSWRTQGIAMLLGACLLGLDLLPWLAALVCHRTYPDVQFWLSDRSPGWLHMLLWSPHHIAGLVCCGLGTLLLVKVSEVDRKQQIVHALLAGVCFAAAAGTSTFITLLFASACSFLFIDALLRRQGSTVVCMAGAGALALLLDAAFFYSLLLSPAAATAPATDGARLLVTHGTRLLVVWPRYAHQSLQWVRLGITWSNQALLHRQVDLSSPQAYLWTQRLLRPPVAGVIFLLDFGFFAFVLVRQARRDLFSSHAVGRQARVLWLIFAGIAIPGCLLNSAGLQDNNDLGRHAGLCMRYVLLLWATPLIAEFLDGKPLREKLRAASLWQRWAICCAALGFLGQIAQIALDRMQMPLTDAGLLPRVVVAERVPQVGRRFAQMQAAMAFATQITPSSGIVQANPHSRFNMVMLLYSGRQTAASDDGCNTPFGGDPRQCAPLTTALVSLFGGSGRHFQGSSNLLGRIPFNPAAVNPQNFNHVCATYRLTTVVANYADPAWQQPQSWVWQTQPAFANGGARVFRCPTIARSSEAPVSRIPTAP